MSELAKTDEQMLKEWQARHNSSPKPKVNTIYLDNKKLSEDGKEINKDFGKLFAVSWEDEYETKEEIDIKKAEFFVAKVRVQVRSSKADAEGKALFWAREVDDTNLNTITVYGQDNQFVEEGYYAELKPKYDLKYTNAVYVVYQDKVYRWIISGAHFETWFPIKNKVVKAPYTIKVAAIKPAVNGTVHYNVIDFALGNPYPIAEAIKVLDSIDATLAEYYRGIEAKKAIAEAPHVEHQATPDDLPF